jgi:hypothetical protein
MMEDKEPVAKPSSLDEIMKLPEAKGAIPLIIAIIAPSGKAQRVNVTLDSALLTAIDLAASVQHKSRSALLAEAAQRLLGEI